MSTSELRLPAHWQFYADHANQTHLGRVDDFGYGREELLLDILKEIQAGTPFTDDCRQRLDRVPQNRAKKYRRLRLLGRQSLERSHINSRSSRRRKKQSGEENNASVSNNSNAGSVTCRSCGQGMSSAEHHAYGFRCENCWSAAMSYSGCDVGVASGLDLADLLEQVRGRLSPEEWEVECRLAAGGTYAEVSNGHKKSSNALKVRAGRWRARIRATLVA